MADDRIESAATPANPDALRRGLLDAEALLRAGTIKPSKLHPECYGDPRAERDAKRPFRPEDRLHQMGRGPALARADHNHDFEYLHQSEVQAVATPAATNPISGTGVVSGGDGTPDYGLRVVYWDTDADKMTSGPIRIYAEYSADAGVTWSDPVQIAALSQEDTAYVYRDSERNYDPAAATPAQDRYTVVVDGVDSVAMRVPRAGRDGKLDISWMPAAMATNAEVTAEISAARPLQYADGLVPGGNTVANTGSLTYFASTYTIPANRLVVGSVIRVELRGVYGTDIIAPTLTGIIEIDGVTMLTTGAVTFVSALTNLGWVARFTGIVVSAGAAGTIECQGDLAFSSAASAALAIIPANTAAKNVDTTVSRILKAAVVWGTAHAANTITLRTMTVEILDT